MTVGGSAVSPRALYSDRSLFGSAWGIRFGG
jgi:hypothetical protein